MEAIKNGQELPKKVRPSNEIKNELISNLNNDEEMIPDWKSFEIDDIADINNTWNPIMRLKNLKIDKKGRKYITIKWRKYYEYSEESQNNSIFVMKGNNLFIWDKFEWLSYRSWVSFRYSNKTWEEIEFTQSKTKYSWWVFHLQQTYKSKNYTSSKTLVIIRRHWKIVKVTENMVQKYLMNPEDPTINKIILDAKKQSPEFFAYMQSLTE